MIEKFNTFLVQKKFNRLDYKNFFKDMSQLISYEVDKGYNIEGKLFVKKTMKERPAWSNFAEKVVGNQIKELATQSSSAVLIVKSNDLIMAFTFGYGRSMIDLKYFVHDYGIKTSLNSLEKNSLRSVDLVTLDEQPILKKAQTPKNTDIFTFGIDVSKDILRAVTGSPKKGILYKNISGSDYVYSFSIDVKIEDLNILVKDLYNLYQKNDYKNDFHWVDNIRKISIKSEVDIHDKELCKEVIKKSDKIILGIPEIYDVDSIKGFSFTRGKKEIKPEIEYIDYFLNVNLAKFNIDKLKSDNLFVFYQNGDENKYPIYKCIYFEYKNKDRTFIFFSGQWYEVTNDFIKKIEDKLKNIKISSIKFPNFFQWREINKDGKSLEKIEAEGDYNLRIARKNSYFLFDKDLIKTDTTTSSIEFCDLMSKKNQLIHVKHRKGGSAGLSHLFAQGSVSSELLLGDKQFRKIVRGKLKRKEKNAEKYVPLNTINANQYEIVFLILGEGSLTIKENLPFFSKINLTKIYENLTQKGFIVSIAGASKSIFPKYTYLPNLAMDVNKITLN